MQRYWRAAGTVCAVPCHQDGFPVTGEDESQAVTGDGKGARQAVRMAFRPPSAPWQTAGVGCTRLLGAGRQGGYFGKVGCSPRAGAHRSLLWADDGQVPGASRSLLAPAFSPGQGSPHPTQAA